MKKLLRCLSLTLLCALCALVPVLAAHADSDALLGVRAGKDYDLGDACPTQTVCGALDWLDDCLDYEVGYLSEASTDLLELASMRDSAGGSIAISDDLAEFAERRVLNASAIKQEIQYFFDRLQTASVQIPVLEEQIRGGEFDKAAVDQMMAERDALAAEAVRLLSALPTKSVVWTDRIRAEQGIYWAAPNEPSVSVASLRNAAQAELHRQAETIQGNEPSPVVYVISDKELGFSVKDKMGSEGRVIEGVEITLVSLDGKGKEIAKAVKSTNREGVAIFWIADLKPNKSGTVTLDVTYDGKNAVGGKRRLREFGLVDMSGGDTFEVPLKAEDGKPYLIRATYDNRDMLNIVNGVYMTPKNDVDHKIELKMQTQGHAQRLRAWYWTTYPSWETLFSETFVPSGGNNVVSIPVTKHFAQKGASGAFPVDKAIYFEIKAANSLDTPADTSLGDSHEEDRSSFSGQKAHNEESAGGKKSKDDPSLIGGFKFAVPDVVPVLGGMTLTIPLETGFDFYMEVGVAWRFGYNRKVSPEGSEKEEAGAWKNQTLKDQEKRIKKIQDSDANCIKKMGQGIASDYLAMKKEKYLASSLCSITPYVFLNTNYNFKTNHAEGSLSFGVILMYEFKLTRQFMLVVVPAFICFEFTTTLSVGLEFGAQGDIQSNGSIKNLKMSSKFGFNVIFRVDVSLTVGAGLPRFAYVGLQGCAWLELDAVIGKMDFTYDLGIGVNAVVKLLWFDKSWVLWQRSLNNKKSSPGLQNSLFAQMATGIDANGGTYTIGEPELGNVEWSEADLLNPTVKETELIRDLGVNNGDIKLMYGRSMINPNGNPAGQTELVEQYVAFYLKKDGDTQRLYTARRVFVSGQMRNYPNEAPKALKFGTRQNFTDNVYAFDVMVWGGVYGAETTFLVTATGGKAKMNFPDGNEAEKWKQIVTAQKGEGAGIYTCGCVWGVKENEFHEYGDRSGEDVYPAIKGEGVGLLAPRITLVSLNDREYYPAVAWVECASTGGDPATYGDKSVYRIHSATLQNNAVRGKYDNGFFSAKDFFAPDIQLAPYLVDNIPLTVALAQRRGDAEKSELLISSANGQKNVRISDNAFSTMSGFRDLTDKGQRATGMILMKKKPNGQTGSKGDLTNELSLLLLKIREPNHSVITSPTLSITSLGTDVSADGAQISRINYWRGNGTDLISSVMYVVWVEAEAQKTSSGKRADLYVVKACMLDVTGTTPIASKQFKWFKIGATFPDSNTVARKPHTFQLYDVDVYNANQQNIAPCQQANYTFVVQTVSQDKKTITNRYGLARAEIKHAMSIGLRAFSTEHAIVTQGRDFAMYFRLENAGTLITKSVNIEVVASPLDSNRKPDQSVPPRPTETLKNIHVDMLNPDKNSVTNSDFTHLPEAERTMTGPHTVYRMPDIMDAYNGENVVITTYDYQNGTTVRSDLGDSMVMTGTPTQTPKKLNCLLPGAIATFKTTVTNSPKKWHGLYALKATITQFVAGINIPTEDGDASKQVFIGAKLNGTGAYDIYHVDVAMDGTETWAATPLEGEIPFLYSPPVAIVETAESKGIDPGLFTTNNALNETLLPKNSQNDMFRGDERFADIEYNDISLEMETIQDEGKYYALVNLSNDTYLGSPDVVPKLMVGSEHGIQTADELTGKSFALNASLDGGFSRALVIPATDLVTPGTPYEQLTLTAINKNDAATQKADINYSGYFESNVYNNTDSLMMMADFVFIQQPQSVTVGSGGSATFTAEVAGPDSLKEYTYQWYATYPDHSVMLLPGQTGRTLTISNVTTSHNGMRYWCVATSLSGRGMAIMSDVAELTVPSEPWDGDDIPPAREIPQTGDGYPLYTLICVAAVSFVGAALLGLKRRGKKE